jgi:sec-independent protein translocase protein TatC
VGLRTRRAGRDEQLSVVDHLDELRTRLVISVVALVVAFIGLYVVRNPLLEFLQAPLPERFRESGLITLSPTEPFFTTLKVCFWASVIVAIPVWLYQVYAFVIPAVGEQSRRMTLLIVAGVSSLFLAGVAFGYWVVLPVALEFLLGFGSDQFQVEVQAQAYYGFATALMLGSGIMFEVPAAMLAAARMGVVSAEQFRSQWRVAVVVIAVIAAILPGGDPFSMLLLMAPQLLLYGLGILLAARFGRPVIWRPEQGTDGEGGTPERS